MNIRFNVEFQLNIGGNFLQGNIKVMNTGHLTLILPVECFICGKKSLKITKGQSESYIEGLTIQNIHRQVKIEKHEPH